MANEQNLVSLADRTTEEKRDIAIKGGQVSGQVRKEKATFKKAIEWLVNSDIKITKGDLFEIFKKQGLDISKLNPTQLATLGLWYGALQGNATNYKTLMEANNEIVEDTTSIPTIKIEINDNSNLEKALYEEDRLNKDDETK